MHATFNLLPKRMDTILFESNRGLGIYCNPKALAQYISQRYPSMKIVWSIDGRNRKNIFAPKSWRLVNRFSIRYYYYLATSKILISNAEYAENLPVHPSQFYLNTQHGTPLKLMGRDWPKAPRATKKKGYTKNGRWSALAVQNSYSKDIFTRVFSFSGPTYTFGQPRNDLLFDNDPQRIASKRKELGLPKDRIIILYAPTWRDYVNNRGDESFEVPIDFGELANALGEKYAFVLRLHPLMLKRYSTPIPDGAGTIYDASGPEYDIQELMLASDILLTDYSSVMFDFAITRKPIIFYTHDIDVYKSERGIYFDLEADAPGSIVHNFEGLKNAIVDLRTQRNPHHRYESFYAKFCSEQNRESTKLIVDEILLPHFPEQAK